ncbi:MAG: movement protein [Tomato alphanucleorhabdovirus 1]|uniref:Movement protein n=1 Tax=Tomato alphanucleorhabdovirus 1 TaxID=2950883 RepID=A0AAE9SHZ4_9RHAB|nr:MAG: movement protein [Tomato alphanucleorhabdovirus 1]
MFNKNPTTTMADIKGFTMKDKKLTKDGMEIALPVKTAAMKRLGVVRRVMGNMGSDARSFVRLTKFSIIWKPTCPPESPGTFAFEFFYESGDAKHVILKGKGMIGHAVKIIINTSIYINKEQLQKCPYKVDIIPGTVSDEILGSIVFEMYVSGLDNYPKNGIRNVNISVEPPTWHGMPSIFYQLNPQGDQFTSNITSIIPILDDFRESFPNLIKKVTKKDDMDVIDLMVLKYMLNDDEMEKVKFLEEGLRPGFNVTSEDLLYLMNLFTRFNMSSYRPFATEITGELNRETQSSTTRF